MAGVYKIFYRATAAVVTKGVILSSLEVKHSVAVQYAFKDFVTGELFNYVNSGYQNLKRLSFIIQKSSLMPDTLYVRIKKAYAAAIIKDLQKLDAVELLEEAPIPDCQKKEVRKRLKHLHKNPSKAVRWNDASKIIKQLAK